MIISGNLFMPPVLKRGFEWLFLQLKLTIMKAFFGLEIANLTNCCFDPKLYLNQNASIHKFPYFT